MKKELLVWDLGKLMIVKAYKTLEPGIWLINNCRYRKKGTRFCPENPDEPIYEVVSETIEENLSSYSSFL